MRVKQIDNRLYAVQDIVTDELSSLLLTHDWSTEHGNMFLNQPGAYVYTARKALDITRSKILKRLDMELRQAVKTLSKLINLEFSYYYTDFWFDPPGFEIPMHTDCFVPCSFQVYWVGESNTGTTFCNTKQQNDLRYQFDFIPNTGYLMLNLPEDNFQPLQWHGMFQPITKNRFTTYSRLGPYFPL